MNLKPFYYYLETLAITFWVGALWTTAFITAPLLFEVLDSSAQAGQVASQLFSQVTVVSLALGSGLLALGVILRPVWRKRIVAAAVIMIVSLAIMEFVVAGWMEAARDQGAERSVLVQLHGLAAFLYITACGAGLVLLARRRKRDSL